MQLYNRTTHFFHLLLFHFPMLMHALNSCSRCFYKCSTTTIWMSRQSTSKSDYHCGDIQKHRLRLIEHIEGDMLNFEYYYEFLPTFLIKFIRRLPKFFRLIKPVAKAGIRTYGAPATPELKRMLIERFPIAPLVMEHSNIEGGEVKNSNTTAAVIGVFVYMFVQESCRGGCLGETLLQLAYRECIRKGYRYMLLVHDDNGSGKLIRYYEARGFQSIHPFIPKGMIRQLLQ